MQRSNGIHPFKPTESQTRPGERTKYRSVMYASQPNNLYSAPARGGGDFLQGSSDAKLGQKVRDPLLAASRWLKRRSDKEKTALGCVAGVLVSFVDLHAHAFMTASHVPCHANDQHDQGICEYCLFKDTNRGDWEESVAFARISTKSIHVRIDLYLDMIG